MENIKVDDEIYIVCKHGNIRVATTNQEINNMLSDGTIKDGERVLTCKVISIDVAKRKSELIRLEG